MEAASKGVVVEASRVDVDMEVMIFGSITKEKNAPELHARTYLTDAELVQFIRKE